MFKNYFQIAWRNIVKHKVYSIINISGLAIGISAALVIYLFINYELSFENFRENKANTYRVVTNMHFPGQDFKNGGAPGPLAAAMRSEIPGIEKSTVFWNNSAMKVNATEIKDNKNLFKIQDDIAFVDDQYFGFFKYDWLYGSKTNALNGINKVVLSASRAKLYFPSKDLKDVIGQTIIYNDSVNTTVTGIVKDIAEATDLHFKEFISLSTFSESLKNNHGWDQWGSVNSASQFFIQLKHGVDPQKVNTQLATLRKKYAKDNAYLATDHFLQPINDIHFNADFDAFGQRQGHKPTLYGLLAVAAFLLILGCINFINLTTAQASQRAKEIGIRKTMGGSRPQLIMQFLSETLMLTSTAAILSVALVPWILKLFSDYLPQDLHFDLFAQPTLFMVIAALVVVVSFLSGFYPALVLSGYKPVMVLKNLAYANTAQSRRVWIRKTLTISQFVIAQFFIIATMVVGKQISYSLNKDLGFKKEAIINFNTPYDYQHPDNKQFVLQQKLKEVPGIERLSLAGAPPADKNYNISTIKFNNGKKDIETSVEVKDADTAYFGLYKMKLIAGRNVQQSDTTKEFVINETFCKQLGYKDPNAIIGQFLIKGDRKTPIVGVLADFYAKSLHADIPPLAYSSEALEHSTFHIALPPKDLNTDNWKKTIAAIEMKWKEVYPDDIFQYEFFDASIAKFYQKEKDTAKLLNWSTGLAIFISCLGLLGLVMFTTNQRIKEIGVRKVLGASVSQIVSLLSVDFIKLVLLAFIIAAPLAWWGMHKWLEDFAFKTQISWWVFALSGLMMIIAACITLSIQTIRAAHANPVKSLRTE
ncbi:MAG: ABC transporter permease [Ferruginibacter sp.]